MLLEENTNNTIAPPSQLNAVIWLDLGRLACTMQSVVRARTLVSERNHSQNDLYDSGTSRQGAHSWIDLRLWTFGQYMVSFDPPLAPSPPPGDAPIFVNDRLEVPKEVMVEIFGRDLIEL